MEGQLYLVDPLTSAGMRRLEPADLGQVNEGFSERLWTQLVVRGSGDFQLFVDDAPLQKSTIGGEAGWIWKPGFYAGTVRAELVDGTSSQHQRYLFDVAPSSGKLGQETFNRLLSEIIAFDPTLIFGDEPATHTLGGTADYIDLGIQYAHLFQHGQDLVAALNEVARHPRRVLKAARHVVPLSCVRRTDLQTALGVARNGTLAALSVDDEQPEYGHRNWRFDVPISMESLDSAATRCVAAHTRAVLRRACYVLDEFEARAASEEESDTRTLLRDRWPRRRDYLNALITTLQAILLREPFRSAGQDEPTAAGLTAVAADPIYARARRVAWKVLRPDSIGHVAEGRSWMSPTWDLYEKWCRIRLGQALQEVLPTLKWKRYLRADCIHGVQGKLSVRLSWQKTFRFPLPSSPLREFSSISKELRPDFVITIDKENSTSWLVLDAKYSAGRSVLGGMQAAHIYHDALRRWGKPPLRSLLMLPAQSEGCDWLHQPAFQATHGVGIITCSPEPNQRAHLTDTIRHIIKLTGVEC